MRRLSMLEHVIRKNKKVITQAIVLRQAVSRVAPFLHHELSDVVAKQKTHIAAKKRIKDEEQDLVRNKRPMLSFGYKFKGTVREAYASPEYEALNAYELHYGKNNKPSGHNHFYEEGKNSTPEKEDDALVLNPEQANNTIQRIIYGVLFGALSDISVEERERFAQWRQFNKHLRRFYEGEAHYFSSITKTV